MGNAKTWVDHFLAIHAMVTDVDLPVGNDNNRKVGVTDRVGRRRLPFAGQLWEKVKEGGFVEEKDGFVLVTGKGQELVASLARGR